MLGVRNGKPVSMRLAALTLRSFKIRAQKRKTDHQTGRTALADPKKLEAIAQPSVRRS
jgi:hypothetical protein